jgi:hypothetical protein
MLFRRKPLLGHEEIVLAVRCDQEDLRYHKLPLTSLESARAKVGCFIPQDLPRRCGEVSKRALDVGRAVGGLHRLCEPRQGFCPQCLDIAVNHSALHPVL